MKRGRKIVMVAHCLLNVNAKVYGLALYPGACESLIELLTRHGCGIIQLPCPEISYYGLRRWGQVYEQLDIPGFRSHCHHLLDPIVSQIVGYYQAGYEICGIIGIDKSPSCGVTRTCSSQRYSGEISAIESLDEVNASLSYPEGPGVFMEELIKILSAHHIPVDLYAIDEESGILPPEIIARFTSNNVNSDCSPL